jgi:hypothetical protein
LLSTLPARRVERDAFGSVIELQPSLDRSVTVHDPDDLRPLVCFIR